MAIPESQVAVVMVPLPAQGHLNQLLSLSRIISAAGIPVHYIGGANPPPPSKAQSPRRLGPFIRSQHSIPRITNSPFQQPSTQPPRPNQIPDSASSITLCFHTSPTPCFHIREHNLKQDIDSVPNVESYCFRSVSAFTVYSYYWEAAGRPDLPAGARILKEIPTLDGLFPPEFAEFEDLQMNSRKNFSGDIFNSSRVIEGLCLDFLRSVLYRDLLAKQNVNVAVLRYTTCTLCIISCTSSEKIWALGPFNPFVFRLKNERHKCLEWLDKQEVNSVIFVSFGTTSSLSDEQIQEVAFGLERSGHKFIWVVRDADKGDIFAGEVREAELPEGFEERVRERGVIVRDWAPQLEILGHCSTGGFMSHCGWNSCTESISMGVPIAAWPMHSDQPGNAFLVTKVLRIGVEVVDWGRRDGVVSSERVESAVRKLMGTEEGDEMRRRAQELGVSVKNSLMEDGRSKEMDLFKGQVLFYPFFDSASHGVLTRGRGVDKTREALLVIAPLYGADTWQDG
ncbi:hypothetical protein ACS0TY_031728 [Phlomoides rotata]